jgi:hypothetical protein
MPALIGYDRCPRHLREIEAFKVDAGTAERLVAAYEQLYLPDYEDCDESRAYELAAMGYEVASWYVKDGAGRFAMIRVD